MNKIAPVIIIVACILSSCGNDPKKNGNSSEGSYVTEEGKSNKAQKTYGKTAEEFLESLGATDEDKGKYLQKLKELENMNADSAAFIKMLEDLMTEEILQEQRGNQQKERHQKKGGGNFDDLTTAFEKLNAESGVEATIGKLKKVDSITGQNSFQVLDMDQETIDKMSEKTKSAAGTNNKKTAPKDKMTSEEIDMMRAFSKANSNVHNTTELDMLEQIIATTDLEKMEAENMITERYAQRQGNEFDRIMKRLALKKKEVTIAQQTFKKLNPDLYFGDEVGMTYFGNRGKAVYLPLGKLSFVDQVINFWHPENINTAYYTIGEPDAFTTGMNSVMNAYSMGKKGTLIVKFEDNALVDVNGPDLYVFELGAIEPTNLDISIDGKNWIPVGEISGGVAEVDIHDFVEREELFYYVRLTDLETSSGIPGADVDAIAAIGSAVRLNLDSQVLFDFGKSELKIEGKKALRELVNSIVVLKSGNVIVEGHTDDIGDEAANKALSLERAKSVSTELKKLLPDKNFKWREKGQGESKPLVENDSDENRAKNRRVEILVLPN